MNTFGDPGEIKRINPEVVPRQVREVMSRLEQNNFRAYLVGGVVRDIILGRGPKDYDIATSATPAQVRELFPRVIPTGERHGTVTVLNGGLGVEVTTLRREGRYSDNRRPDTVEFTQSLREDLSRRDFTMNSLAVGSDGFIYDFFGGIRDISGGIIRAVGSPGKRFREDALRMVRAVRLACQTGFSIEEKTLQSVARNCRLTARVSRERIREELNAILLSEQPHRGIGLVFACGLAEYILPELADRAQVDRENGRGDFLGHTLEVIRRTPPRLNVRLAALVHGVGRPECRTLRPGEGGPGGGGAAAELLDSLKYDRRTVRAVASLVENSGPVCGLPDRKSIKRLIARVGVGNIEDLFALLEAESGAAGLAGGAENVRGLREASASILGNREPIQVRDLAINGNDLKALGFRPGREMGAVLEGLLEEVLDSPGNNEREYLLELARRWRK